ncbi:hypothetical protein SAMN04488505_108180 [Chitinophaga rupis]|uniref:Uncharacterized protein n=1 Tax=Chitinophaga rupis TaxID=573321 RepID=A0A1H8E3J4_9BACT|nr:hypothetical protein SAMN04488505_108180 [Chitinophaga rupis]
MNYKSSVIPGLGEIHIILQALIEKSAPKNDTLLRAL